MTGLVIVLIVAVAAMWLFFNRKGDARQMDCQSRGLSKSKDTAESSKLTQKHWGSGRGVQNGQTATALSNASDTPIRESRKKGESAKANQAVRMLPEDGFQRKNRIQSSIDGEERGLTFKTFEELGEYWNGQDSVVPRLSPRTPKTLPNRRYHPAQGVRKPGNDHRSTKTQRAEPSASRNSDSRANSGRGFCPHDPAIYVLGQPNIRNHRSKRYARTRVAFWR